MSKSKALAAVQAGLDIDGLVESRFRKATSRDPLKPYQKATFTEFRGVIDCGIGGIAASLGGVKGHLTIPDGETVCTSRIHGIGYAPDGTVRSIITNNTIYTKGE